jgi:hypothetical protein
MDWRLRLPGALYRRAAAKAGGPMPLAALVLGWLTRYVDGSEPHRRAAQIRAERLSPARRSDIARMGAQARAAARASDH